MATREELMGALRRADAAGDTAAAQAIARRIQSLQSAPQQAAPTQPTTPTAPTQPAPSEQAVEPPGMLKRALAGAFPTFGGSFGVKDGKPTGLPAGAIDSVLKSALGVKGLFGGNTAEDRQRLEAIEAEKAADPSPGWRTTGDVMGSMATMAVPGGAAMKIPKVAAYVKAHPYLAPMIAGALEEFVFDPSKKEDVGDQVIDRLTNAAKAAGTTAALQGAGKAVGKAATQMFKPTRDAQIMFDNGVVPRLHQGAQSRTGRFIGGLTSGFSNLENTQAVEVGDSLLRRATEGMQGATGKTGREIEQAVSQHVDDAYNQIYAGKRFNYSPKAASEAVAAATKLNTLGQHVDEAAQAGKIASGIVTDPGTNRRFNVENFRKGVLNKVSDRAYEQGQNQVGDEVRRRLLTAKKSLEQNVLEKSLSPAELARKKEIDRLNFDLERIRDTIGDKPRGAHEGLDLTDLTTAYSKKLAEGRSMGNTTNDEFIEPMIRALKMRTQNQDRSRLIALNRAIPGVGKVGGGVAATAGATGLFGPAAALPISAAYALSIAGQTKGGAKALFGQHDWQKALAKALRDSGDLGNMTLTPAMATQLFGEN